MTRKQRKYAKRKALIMQAIDTIERDPELTESANDCLAAWRNDDILYAALEICRRLYDKQHSPGAKKPHRLKTTMSIALRK